MPFLLSVCSHHEYTEQRQVTAVAITIVYSAVLTFMLLKIIDAVIGLRATDENERIGLDLTDHRETGYTMLD